MNKREQEPDDHDPIPALLNPCPLPPELVDFLRDRSFACLTHGTDQGTVIVVKAPRHEIWSLGGRVPVHLRYELYDDPAAPVVRMVVRIHDQPEHPLALETFINVEDPGQRDDLAALAAQDRLIMLFYDERLAHRLTKTVPHPHGDLVTQILNQANSLLAGIPRERFDFDAAKSRIMEATSL